MKIDYDKNHPFTSVSMIPEGNEDEYLTEEQTKEFKKQGLRCVHISYVCVFFSLFALICELTDGVDLFHASKIERVFAFVGYFGLAGLIISIVFLFIEGRKLTKLSEKYDGENSNNEIK